MSSRLASCRSTIVAHRVRSIHCMWKFKKGKFESRANRPHTHSKSYSYLSHRPILLSLPRTAAKPTLDFLRNSNSNSAGIRDQPHYLDIPDWKLIDEVRIWLKPTEYLSPGNEYMKHLHSYVPGTGDWLRSSPTFRKWEDSTENGCLWVKGVPGSGKSVFAASTLKTLARNEGKPTPVLFFFFRQIVERNHDPKYLVRDWAAQLLPFSKVLGERLSVLKKGKGVDGIELTEVWDAVVEALGGMEKVYCVADALDEMDDQYAWFVERLRDLGMWKPGNVKVLLTSRPVPRLEMQLRHVGVEAVKLDPTSVRKNI